MRTVYIVGAGCTRNYETENEYNLPSPLDIDFFKICNTILLKRKDILSAFSDLLKHLESLFGLKLPSENEIPEFSLESVTTILNLESKEKGREYIDALINLICIVFDIALVGPVSDIHRELAKRIQPNDAVISYNYDLVLDNAVMDTKRVEEGIYRLNFDQKYENDWKQCDNEPSDILFLKLHGSLNWLKCNRCGALLFYKGRKAVAELSYQIMKIKSTTRELNCPLCETRELKPLLIPPLLEKELYGEEFKYPWYLAEKTIVSADRIVVIGYSLPPTDFYSEYMLRKAMSKRFRRKPIVQIVDLDTKRVPKRLETVVGTEIKEIFQDLKEYLVKTET
jgi:NAD-dependent SIR2 family protein deacetylase